MHISACIVAILGAGPGSFGEPARVSAGDGAASDPGADLIGSTLLAAHVEGDVLILRAAHGGDPLEIARGAEKGARPRVAVGELGRISVLYLGPGDAPRLLLAESNAGEFGPPVEVASGLERDAPHDLVHGPRGGLRVLYGSGPGASELVLVAMAGGSRHPFQGGAHPSLAVDAAGFVHVSCVRDGLVRHRTDRDAEDFSSETTLEGAQGVRSAAMAAAGETLHWLVETQEGIRHGLLDPGGPVRWSVAAVPGLSPALAVSPSGTALALHLRNGVLLAAATAPGGLDLGAPFPLFAPSLSGEIRGHGVRADVSGHFHAFFEWAGEVYLSNDVPPPSPSFRADPTEALQGEPIHFEDLSAGTITSLDWDFGDGAWGEGPLPVHRYLEPGTYTVTLHARGPGGSRSFELPERIRILPALNVLEIPRIRAALSNPRITVPVLVTNDVPIGGFQLAMETAPLLSWTGFSSVGTDTQRLAAELVSVDIETADSRSAVIAAVLWDWEEPYDGRTLPPVNRHALLLLDFDIAPGAAAGESLSLSFVSDFGPQKKGNVLAGAEGSASIIPFTRDGVVIVESLEDGVFIRGDSNGDDRIDISDAIGTLLYLFVGGVAPGCPDAADTNDDGELDISDGVETLQYLFAGGRYPAYPFPGKGLDGSPDSLPLCSTP